MHQPQPHARIELDLAGGNISGAFHHGDGAAERFTSWLELASLVEQARGQAARDAEIADGTSLSLPTTGRDT